MDYLSKATKPLEVRDIFVIIILTKLLQWFFVVFFFNCFPQVLKYPEQVIVVQIYVNYNEIDS